MIKARQQLALRIDDASQVAAARRAASDIAHQCGFDETHIGKIALLATEAATNILKHAGGGEILMQSLSGIDAAGAPLLGVELLAIDNGPGIACVNHSLTDGVSSTGTSGTGLGAMQRIATFFEIFTQRDKGTVLCLRLWNGGRSPIAATAEIGAVCIPMPGETACGDGWSVVQDRQACNVLVADGLGHGPDAAEAADAAIATLEEFPSYAPGRLIEYAHDALRATRGAAVAAGRLDRAAATLSFAGVGNIAATILHHEGRRQLVSHSGIVGNNVRKVQEFTVPWQAGDMLVLNSDGLASQWSLEAYPGLQSYDTAIIAAVLYRDFWRRRDDVTVLVMR